MNRRVVVVDDDPVALRMLEDALRGGGFEVIRAYRAEDALRKVKCHKPDIVLTDLEMPGVNGVDLIAMIRADPEIQDTPILAVSGFTWEPIAQAAAQYGSDGQIAKPFTRQQVLEKIEECLAGARAAVPNLPRPAAESAVAEQPSHLRLAGASAGDRPPADPVPAAERSTGVVFDREAFLMYVDGDLNLAQRAIELLLGTLPERLDGMRKAVARNDHETLRTTAHTVKGAAAFFAAPAVLSAVVRLETMGISGDLTNADVAYFELERALASLEEALGEFVSEVVTMPAIANKAAEMNGAHLDLH